MLNLTVEGIKDFSVCELFYDYRYRTEDHLEVMGGRELMSQRFENTLKKVASYFFYKKQADIIPSYNAILNRWEKLWFPKDMTAYDMAVEQHEISHGNLASYSNTAAAALEKFHDQFSDDDYKPILIDESFMVPLSLTIRLEGQFDLILRKGDHYKVVKWSGKQKKPNASTFLLDFAALRHAFDYRNDTAKKVEYCLYDLASSKAGFVKVDQPRTSDVDALKYWAISLQGTETFVPRRGYTAYCRGCPFDEDCAEWTAWPSKS